MSELKPCPHCGSKAIVVEDNSAWKVFCTSPDCDAQYGWCASREYAIRGWNRRTMLERMTCKNCKYAREKQGEPWICTHPDNNAWRITKEFYCGRAERSEE